jgi:prophage regulatory protein
VSNTASDQTPCVLDRIVGKSEVSKIIGLKSAAIDSLEKAGGFPRRLKIGNRRIGWRLSDVIEWLASLEEVEASAASGE